MTVYVIDGQGGGIGKSLIEQLRAQLPAQKIVALGTNAMATANMLKAGANVGATGENAVVCCCSDAREEDFIVGPIGILLADAMMGELTEKIAFSVAKSLAQKVLIPVSRCRVTVAGTGQKGLSQYLSDAAAVIAAAAKAEGTPL